MHVSECCGAPYQEELGSKCAVCHEGTGFEELLAPDAENWMRQWRIVQKLGQVDATLAWRAGALKGYSFEKHAFAPAPIPMSMN